MAGRGNARPKSGRDGFSHLLIKPLNPTLQILQLFGVQIGTIVERPVEVLGQHLLIEALAREPPGGISTREVLVGSAGTVEVAAAGHVVDFAAHRQVDWLVLGAVVGQ